MIIAFIQRAIVQGIPLLFGSTGEIITEKSGNLNLGTAGVMYVGGISGVIGAFLYEGSVETVNPVLAVIIPILSCILGSLIMGLIYSFLTVTLRANQNVTGLAITLTQTSNCFKTTLPFADKLGWFGEIFLSYSFLAYVAIAIALLAAFYFNRTRSGLSLRAVGENPATADAAGISVSKYKYLSTCVGSIIAGFGGLYYVMDYACGIWSNDAFGDRGWLAIALVIFAIWRPNVSIIGSIVFGGLLIIHNYIPGLSFSGQEILKMTPYVVTIIVLIIISMRQKRENQPPASLGLSYFREER